MNRGQHIVNVTVTNWTEKMCVAYTLIAGNVYHTNHSHACSVYIQHVLMQKLKELLYVIIMVKKAQCRAFKRQNTPSPAIHPISP